MSTRTRRMMTTLYAASMAHAETENDERALEAGLEALWAAIRQVQTQHPKLKLDYDRDWETIDEQEAGE